jgi:hypothetical protein
VKSKLLKQANKPEKIDDKKTGAASGFFMSSIRNKNIAYL